MNELIGKTIRVGPRTTLRDIVRQTRPRIPRAYTRRVAPGAYTARSHTRASLRHYIGVSRTGQVTCSCEAYVLGEGKTCWAMSAVARRLLRNRRELLEVVSR